MEVKVCRSCRKMFQYLAGPEICPRCKQIEEEWFHKVRDYLRENPGAHLHELNNAIGVSASLVEKFLREGRLQVSSESPISLSCERCGKRISTGRQCLECKKEVANELNEMKQSLIKAEVKKDTGAKMRFLQSDK